MSTSARIEGVLFIREWPNGQGQCTFWCPGCQDGHTIAFGGAETWTWDGNASAPTFSPSVLAHPHTKLNAKGEALLAAAEWEDGELPPLTDEHRMTTPRCHSFVRAGRIEYLSDCEHALAGQTVDMQPLPERWKNLL